MLFLGRDMPHFTYLLLHILSVYKCWTQMKMLFNPFLKSMMSVLILWTLMTSRLVSIIGNNPTVRKMMCGPHIGSGTVSSILNCDFIKEFINTFVFALLLQSHQSFFTNVRLLYQNLNFYLRF